MQPYFLPYIGYFQLIYAVDKFVIYDDVNFIKRGWINRNNILVNGRTQMFTIALAGASQNKLINEIKIADDFKKLTKTLQMNYAKAPFFEQTMELYFEILSSPDRRLSDFIANSLKNICNYIDVKTEFIMSSTLIKDNTLKGEDKIISICQELEANCYINPIGGRELYNKELFKQNDIQLYFINSIPPKYPQFKNICVPGLSIIDILMFNSLKKIETYLQNFSLV